MHDKVLTTSTSSPRRAAQLQELPGWMRRWVIWTIASKRL